MRSALKCVAHRWDAVGSVLGLESDDLKVIERQNHNNVDACLNQMIAKWFAQSKSIDPPTLRKVVGAIATTAGGRNPAHAEEVAEKYAGEYADPQSLVLYFTMCSSSVIHDCIITAIKPYTCMCLLCQCSILPGQPTCYSWNTPTACLQCIHEATFINPRA